ncbi:MAG: trypsin-like peptidase domain-containing protein [Planctomycetes bacterium]|nr:trypsin-like peptidase domain-containing protein [Planctomycetota bacterium]
MAIAVSCECGRALSVPDRMAGKKVLCPHCGASCVAAASVAPVLPAPRAPQRDVVQAPPPQTAPRSSGERPSRQRPAVAARKSPADPEAPAPEQDVERDEEVERKNEAEKRPGRRGRKTTRQTGRASGARTGKTGAMRRSGARAPKASSSTRFWVLLGAGLGSLVVVLVVLFLLIVVGREDVGPEPDPNKGLADKGDDPKNDEEDPGGNGGVADPTRGPQPKSWADLVEEYDEAVVAIHSEGGDGSGFFVDERGLVCTNFHVISDAFQEKGVEVKVFHKDESGKKAPKTYTDIVPIYLDPTIDIALLEIRSEEPVVFKPVRIHAADRYRQAEEIVAIGSPGVGDGSVLENTLTQGTISHSSRERFGVEHVQVDLDLNPGNSGGPIFDHSGEVIAMVAWGYAEKDNLNFAVPARFIREAMEAAPYGSFSDHPENDDARKSIEEYWTALAADDPAKIAPHIPAYLYQREQTAFNLMVRMSIVRVFLRFRNQWSSDRNGVIERLKASGYSIEMRALCRQVFERLDDEIDKPEEEQKWELSSAEIQNCYVEIQRALYKEEGYQEVSIESVETRGAMGKFTTKVKYKDAGGKVQELEDELYCYKDRDAWRLYLAPIGPEDLWDRPR